LSIPLKDWETFKIELLDLSKMIAVGKEKVIEDKVYVQILCEKEILNQVTGVITSLKAEIIELPLLKGTVNDELERLDKRLEQIQVRQGQLEKVARDFSKELKNLRVSYDYYNWRLQQKYARRNFASTESTVLIKGWMPKKSIDLVEKDLKKVTKKFVVSEIEPDEGEDSPVLLLNKGVMKPFQSVTGIYGLPLPNELDPTPYLSIFFIAFYGLALTDAVYGLLMFAIMFVVLKYLKIPKESQGLLRLLMYAGIVTFIMGTLFGGWASLTVEQAPAWLTTTNDVGETVFIGQKISAIKNPLNVLILSLTLGFIQVLVGVYMNFIWKFKNENKKDALIDHFPWVYLLTVIGFGIMLMAGLLPGSLGGLIKILLYIGLAGIVLTQGRDKKNIVLKFLSGVLGLYGLVGYLSDVLSYSRLLALGLATSIIGLAVNTIAGLVNGIPIVGIILALIVLIVGHVFNIGINALGAFIHSGRLQFVEFFTKFMEGGGQAFKPLKRDSKYVRLDD
jgi:V/A-type H+-transporting ATPase subunit I